MDCCRVQWSDLLHCGNVILSKAKITPETPKYEGWRSNFRSRAIWRYHSAINRTSAQNKQFIFVLLSHHQKYTLIGEIIGLYFSWIVDKNSKNTSQFQLVAGSPIHLSAYFSLSSIFMELNEWHFYDIFGITWQFLMVQNILYINVSVMKTHVVCHLVNTGI